MSSIIKCLFLSLLIFSLSGHTKESSSCEELSNVFFMFASNKDTGATFDSQEKMLGAATKPETYKYIIGILKIIYSTPHSNAKDMQAKFMGICTENKVGEIQLPKKWDPWQQNT